MTRFLFAWELGTGLGHVGAFLPIAKSLHERGHQVVVAAKHLSSVKLFSGKAASFPILVTPPELSPCRKAFANTSTYIQLLHNVGFGDLDYLTLRVQAWLDLFQVVKPDVILCDHSPMAQLAARIAGIKYLLLGTGFTCPPTHSGLPSTMSRQTTTLELAEQQEALLRKHCNLVLQEHGGPLLEKFSELYSEAAETLLLTHAELDHFPERPPTTYYGSWNFIQGSAPIFPQGNGPKVFGYLKPSQGVEDLLTELSSLGWPALIVGTGFTNEFLKKHSSKSLIVSNQTVDHEAAAAWCDFGILNSTHASVAVTLRAGKPILCLPLQLEQLLMSRRIVDLKMGGAVIAKDAQSCKLGLKLMGQRFPEMARNAQLFATKYQYYDQLQSLQKVTEKIERLS